MTLGSSSDRTLDRYVADIAKYPLLSRQQEAALSQRYLATGDERAAHRLVVCNLRFVVKTAHAYRGYGLKLLDLVQEGNLGLMAAVRKFDPSKGYRLVSYAVWWIRAYIQSFIMRAWSLVKVGTTQAQRKLFFKLRSVRQQADREAGPGRHASCACLAELLDVGETDVVEMQMRMGERDFSLDAQVQDGGRSAHIDLLPEPRASQEERFARHEAKARLRRAVAATLSHLNDKERYITHHRLLQDEPPTLQQVGETLHISRERVRQIEMGVIAKLRAAFAAGAPATRAA